MKLPFFNLSRQSEALSEPLKEAFERFLKDGQYILGTYVERFEAEFSAYHNVDHTISVGNGTDALTLALIAAGCQKGDEVLVVSNAGAYGSFACLMVGATPVYVDIDPITLTMCPKDLVQKITSHSKAVILTHLYGKMGDVESIRAICKEHQLFLIEDCAQATGASYKGKKAGTWGDVGCFSFYPTKNLGALGDGGAVITGDADIADRLRALRMYGWKSRFNATIEHGRNTRLDPLQAAFLSVKLPYLDAWNAKRRDIVQRYRDVATPGVCVGFETSEDYVAHLCVAICDDRVALQNRLSAQGIPTDIHYPWLDFEQSAIAPYVAKNIEVPVTQKINRQILSLPCYPEMMEEEVQEVCRGLRR